MLKPPHEPEAGAREKPALDYRGGSPPARYNSGLLEALGWVLLLTPFVVAFCIFALWVVARLAGP